MRQGNVARNVHAKFHGTSLIRKKVRLGELKRWENNSNEKKN